MVNFNINKFFDVLKNNVGPRKLKIQNERSFADLFNFASHIFQGEKIFLSEEIFKELCYECTNNKGQIKLCSFGNNNFIYQLKYPHINNKKQKEEINILLKIKGSEFTKKRFQLINFSSSEATYITPKINSGLYLDRAKTLKHEEEKLA